MCLLSQSENKGWLIGHKNDQNKINLYKRLSCKGSYSNLQSSSFSLTSHQIQNPVQNPLVTKAVALLFTTTNSSIATHLHRSRQRRKQQWRAEAGRTDGSRPKRNGERFSMSSFHLNCSLTPRWSSCNISKTKQQIEPPSCEKNHRKQEVIREQRHANPSRHQRGLQLLQTCPFRQSVVHRCKRCSTLCE